ncbi:DMT family transporter [Streptomyces sp. NPDC051452]|uniref:DMT family transporter n=1 Tax=Streptomyces sp. NPDC051452 TaxID=3365654 RepID=UPI0037B33B84
MSALAVSVLLSFVSALAYAGGAIVQEQVAVSSPDSAYLPLRRPSWWGALALNGLGGVLHAVALAYGPLSLVQPLGALTIVFALPMAALFVGRKAGPTAWRGALMATVGLAVLLSLVGSFAAHSLDGAQRVAAGLVTGGAVVALMCAARAAHRHPVVRSVLLATASGTAFGMSSVFTKTVAVDWTLGIGLGELPSLAVIALFAAAGVLLSQASYRGGGLAAPLATLTVVNPVLAAAAGIVMFGETFRYGSTGTVLALSCGVVAAGGLIMLTTERMEGTPTAAGTAGHAGTRAPAGAGNATGGGTPTAPGSASTAASPDSGSAAASEPTAPAGTLRTVPQQRPAADADETGGANRPEPASADDGHGEAALREPATGPVPGAPLAPRPDGAEAGEGGVRYADHAGLVLPVPGTVFPLGLHVPVPDRDRHRPCVTS